MIIIIVIIIVVVVVVVVIIIIIIIAFSKHKAEENNQGELPKGLMSTVGNPLYTKLNKNIELQYTRNDTQTRDYKEISQAFKK